MVRRGPGGHGRRRVGLRDDGFLRHYKYTWGLAAALLLVITFLFGTEINDARLWIVVGPFGFQPSEAIKVMLVIFLAGYLAENRAVLAGASLRLGPLSLPPLPYLAPMLVVFAAVMLVVVVSRDLGTALLFFGVFLTMLFVATGRRAYVLFGMLLFVAGAAVAYALFPHVAERIDTWLDPWGDPSGAGYQTVQAIYAFARGGLLGEGLGQGLPEINGVLPIPAVHTDMIFAAIGEELGLLGGVAVLALVAMIMARGLRIAVLARDDFSTMLAAGLTAGLGLQSLIIIGGNLKVVPLTGITLPFVSYGGSSLVASFVIVGVLLSISRSAERRSAERRPAVIAAHLPRLGTALLAGFAVLVVVMSWWQVAVAASLEARPDNPALIAAHRSQPRARSSTARARSWPRPRSSTTSPAGRTSIPPRPTCSGTRRCATERPGSSGRGTSC